MEKSNTYHVPVMAEEISELLLWKKDGVYVDATLGGGGHSAYFLSRLDKSAHLIGLDVDQDAIEFASKRLKNDARMTIVNLGYDQIDFILEDLGIEKIDGILYDLGISSFQVDEEAKGFSFMKDAPLDMRFDQTQKLTAEQVVNTYSEQDLFRIFKEYGEEKKARQIARKIVEVRRLAPIATTRQLANLVEKIVGSHQSVKSLARIFQAIRIEVNREFEKLSESLDKVIHYLNPNGRIAVLSYHSLEDRLVKNFFKINSTDCICPPELPVCQCNHKKRLEILTKKPLLPSQDEIRTNPRARSAKLRVAKRIDEK